MGTFIVFSLIALLMHESAHLATAGALGVRVKRIGINWHGPFVVREPGEPLSNVCIALSGPVLNLVLAILFSQTSFTFALINLVLGISNLLPIKRSDGRRALEAWREAKQSKVVASVSNLA